MRLTLELSGARYERPLQRFVGLSCSCQVETHHESIDRFLWWNPHGLCLLFERLDELAELATVLQIRVWMPINKAESHLLPERMSGTACNLVDDGNVLK